MKLNNQGQSIIEFLMTITLLMAFIFLFMKISINYVNGYLVHYANFMASRTYLVIDRNSNDPSGSETEAISRAETVFSKYNLSSAIPSFDADLQVNSPDDTDQNAFVGTWVEFVDIFSFSALMGGKSNLNLRAESFLGREPTRAECIQRICRALNDIGSDCEFHVTFDDNGC